MSFEGQVLCQRMLIGPCALTMAGAVTVAAAPAAATFKKRRRVEVLSLVGAVMVFSPLAAGAWRSGLDLLAATQGLARGFGNNDRGDATLRRGLQREKHSSRVVVYSIHVDIFFGSE